MKSPRSVESPMLVTLTVDELASLIDERVSSIVREQIEALVEPSFMTNIQVCKMLGVSKPTVNALVREGMPALSVGRELRFERAAVVAWMRTRQLKTSRT